MSPALRFLSAQHWAIVPSVFDSLVQIVEQHALGIRATPEQVREAQVHSAAFGMDIPASAGEPVMQIRGDTAIIPVRGVIARYSDQINGACQDQGRSAESVQADLAKASQNPNVSRIILRIDSPGGSVAGTAETGAAIRAASAAGKHVVAYVDGMAASAAYWLASQADQVVASADGALVGSIGVIMAMVDATKNQEKQGYKVQVVRSVGLKAPGTANESISPEQLASVQKVVADLHAQFVAAVQTGRGMSLQQMDRAATGEVFTASEGIGMGLVDRIASWDAVLADQSRTRGESAMDAPHAQVTSLLSAPEDTSMSLIKQAKAIADAHPVHAALVWEMAASDHTEEQILAAVSAKEIEAKAAADAAVLADLKAKLAAAAATNAEALVLMEDLKAQAVKAQAEAAALKAHAKGGAAGATIQADGENTERKKVSRAEHDKNPSAYAADVKSGRVVLHD
jgi:signal peptide peptidase SppA